MSQMKKYERYSAEFRAEAVRRLGSADNMASLCRELGISRQLLYKWRDHAGPDPVPLVERQLREENARLKEALAERVLELDFIEGALKKIEALSRSGDVSGGTASTRRCAK